MYTSRVDVYINLGGCVQQPHSRTRYPCNMNDDDDGDTGVSRVIFYLPGKRKKDRSQNQIFCSQNQVFYLGNLRPRSPPGAHPPGGLLGGSGLASCPPKIPWVVRHDILGTPIFFRETKSGTPATCFREKCHMWAQCGLAQGSHLQRALVEEGRTLEPDPTPHHPSPAPHHTHPSGGRRTQECMCRHNSIRYHPYYSDFILY